MVSNDNPCLKYGCHDCCNPVKIISTNTSLVKKMKGNPLFIQNDEDWMVYGMIRLNTFRCLNLNSQSGLCNDYDNRPMICKNKMCSAFKTGDKIKQKEIIDGMKSAKYIRIIPTPFLAGRAIKQKVVE